MAIRTTCDVCGKDVGQFRFLKKINGTYLCKECVVEKRKSRRKETIQLSPDKDEIIELGRKIKREYNKKRYRRIQESKGIKVRDYVRRTNEEDIPKVKGAKRGKPKNKNKSYSYITFEEKQILLRTFMDRDNLDFIEARQRVKETVNQMKAIREDMVKTGKSETEIKKKQREMLEELWRS